MAVDPSSEKNTLARGGPVFSFGIREILTSRAARMEAGSLARPRAEECEIFASWLVILNAHTAGVKSANFLVDYDGGTATIALEGEGLGPSLGGGGGKPSYYACSSGRPTALWPLLIAATFLVRRRRR